jgi:hypothetical protein
MPSCHVVDDVLLSRSLPAGYLFERLRRGEVATLIGNILSWHPDIGVGAASCFVQPGFYWARVAFEPESSGEVHVFSVKHGDRLIGMAACEREPDALALYGRLVVIAPDHRGARLGLHCISLMETVGRELGLGLVYGLATMKIPHVQQAFEQLGWQLIGIAPGYDRELTGTGAVKRVFEAIYAKVLADACELELPCQDDMTPRARTLFGLLFDPRSEPCGQPTSMFKRMCEGAR